MKGQACSWQDMRKIQHILANMTRLKGEYEALMRCADKSTVSKWRKVGQVMDAVSISKLQHVQPAHFYDIGRLATPDTWNDWVQRCEIDRLAVVELRQAIRRHKPQPAREAGSHVPDLQELVREGRTFGTIYADPPWLYDNQGTRAATGNHYSGMTIDGLCALPVEKIAAADAHLHLWTTNAFLFDAPRIFAAWGFEFRSSFVWVKKQMGIGNYWRNSHELLLTAIRGNAKRFADKNLKSWLECGRGRHSEKPDRVADMLEAASPGPRLELFGRRKRDGWTVWGDEVGLV